ncbi:protein PFC0760c-like [Colletes gigas]|uniref:protein PFC0760c-like n=1 Tax=Colletes gigas TaxID=935657 RepID=UPI001C9A652F|nr:protein PFC0760c-like [Colletes gigas]
MPRSAKDSDEEQDVKGGRKARGLAGSVSVDSPLRRSSRVKTAVKHFESSPESPVSDANNVSNTQITRITRRRTSTMDNTMATEKSRTLRSRKNSATSDVSETAEADVTVTPTKKTRSIAANEMFNKSNSRSSKRLVRAGSESKSPTTLTPVRNTRRTRASSMEPDIVLETKKAELHTPIKTKRRTSIAPSEATVAEENEETVRKSTETVERTLPNVKELNETPVINSSSKQINKLLVLSIEKMDTKRENIVENTTEKDAPVEEAQNISAKNLLSDTSEDAETDVFVDDKKETTNDDKTVSKQGENDSTDSVEKEDSLVNVSEVHSQSTNPDASKELGLKVENLLSNSLKEQDEDLSNKENQAANIINESLNKDDIISNVLLQSPKPLSASNINANKIIKEKCKSPSIDSTTHRHSKESSEATIDTVVPAKEITDNSNAANTLTDTNESIIVIKEEDADSNDNMPKLALNTDTESLSMVAPDEPVTKQLAVVEVCDDSSFDDSIQILECVESDKPGDEPTEAVSKSKDPTKEDNESHEDTNVKMDVSSSCIEETSKTNTNTESTEDSASPVKATDDKSETIKETDKSVKSIVSEDKCKMDTEKSSQDVEHVTKDSEDAETVDAAKDTEKAKSADNVMETEELHSTETVSHSDPSNATLSASLDSNIVENTQSLVDSKDESATNNLENMEEAKESKESSESHTSPEDSVPANKDKDNVTNVVKSSQSSTVTETPAESSEEVAEKEELSQKTSALDDSATPKKQPEPKSESSNEQKKTEVNLETSKKNPESMEVDDNDSDTNTINLFQDVIADEWKEKSDDVDKSSVHSMSTERLDNESETECDLILVDREAWLAAENIKMEKEKEVFDYDSDDTVLLKARKDSSKTEQDEKTTNVSKDGGKKMNLRRSKTSNTDSTRKSVQQEEIEDTEHVSDSANKKKSVTKETKESTSTRKSIEGRNISEPQEIEEMEEDLNKSHSDSPLNKSKSAGDISKKRKSLNRSNQKVDNDREKSSETGSAKKKKSLNKSKPMVSEIIDSDSKSEDICTTVKSKGEKGQSSKKKIKPRQIDVNVSEESDDNSKQSEITSKKISAAKKKTNEKLSQSDRDDSESESDKNNSDSDDSQNEGVRLPKFLFDGGSGSDDDNESNRSIDSDIEREYNLNGEDICKFSDDDVPGDECRASETESSDPDDDGSDLIDFVVDDDEVEDDEEEEEGEGEAGGDENEEEMDNEEEDEEVPEDNEKMQVEQETDEVEEAVTEEEDQSKNKQEIVDEKEKKQKVLKGFASEGEEALIENTPKKKQKLLRDVNLEDKKVLLEKLPKKKKVLGDVVSQDVQISSEKVSKKKQKLSKDAQSEEASLEKLPKKKQKLHRYIDAMLDLDEESEIVAFSKAKTKKELKTRSRGEYMQQESQISKKGVKRLSDEFLENLPDVPSSRAKKRKLSKFEDQVLPSRSMFDAKINDSITVDAEDFIPLSSFGGTTKFNVINIQKLKKKKKLPEIVSFRQKMLARNSRQPVSAYLVYLQKQKASSKK